MHTARSSRGSSMPQSQITLHQSWLTTYDIKKSWSTSARIIQSDTLHFGFETIAHAQLVPIHLLSRDRSTRSDLTLIFKRRMLPRSLKVSKSYGRSTSIEASIHGIGSPDTYRSVQHLRRSILVKIGGISVQHRPISYKQISPPS